MRCCKAQWWCTGATSVRVLGFVTLALLIAYHLMRIAATWLMVLGLCTAVGVIGPIIALVMLRDSPDPFVVTSTILVALVPVGALVYSFSRRAA